MKVRIMITSVFLFVLYSGVGFAQTPLTASDRVNRAAADVVHLLPRWKTGEKMRFEIVKTRLKTQNGQATSQAGTRTDLEIEVILASLKGYDVKWTLGVTRFDDPKQAELMGTEMGKAMNKGAVMIFDIDREGSITGIQNWRQLMADYVKGTEIVIKQMQAAGEDKEKIAAIRKIMSSLTREQIESMSTTEASLFYMALGQKYVLSEPITYALELPNPFGGDPFPAKAAYTLKTIDQRPGQATVSWTGSIDKEKGRTSIESTIKSLGKLIGKPMPEGNPLGSFSMDDAAEIYVDIATGWTDRLTYSRTIKGAAGSGPEAVSMTREDTTVITRKMP